MEININYFAVAVSAIGGMFVGFVWYGFLFRKKWMELMELANESMANMKMSVKLATDQTISSRLL